MSTEIYYIDDEGGEAKTYKSIIERSGDFNVTVIRPVSDWAKMGKLLFQGEPAIFLVDYDLSAAQKDGSIVDYHGSTLATEIREKTPGYPIAMVTRKSILDARRRRELQNELRLIDHIIYKDEISDQPQLIAHELHTLATGFQQLREIPVEMRNWDNLLRILAASQQESFILQKASPPLVIDQDTSDSLWSISTIADWIRNVVIGYPGILYDPIYAATELRISKEDFELPEVQEIFEPAKYAGIFSPHDGRWWKERLWEIAMRYVENDKFADKFAPTFCERTGKELAPSVSIVRGESPADAVCYVYHQPVMYKYTVAYRPDNRPPVMDQARVSFKAVQETKVQRTLIESASDELLTRIREMDL